jgi:mannose-6-phosphate isomerase-like protein (cupin superfamily)
MSATKKPGQEVAVSRGALESRLRIEGLNQPRWWSNGPGDEYGWHAHEYHKVLYCASGSIVFHTRDGDFALTPGDRLDIEPGTDHAATVGSDGVTCVEAARHVDER